jgi:short-subunit dehydrogenase
MNPARSRTILITGASSGLGAAIARELAQGGHRLAITARRADRLEALKIELEALGAEMMVIPAALEEPDAPERIIEATVARFGGLDVLINNAGYGLPGLFAGSEPGEIRRQVEVNLVAPLVLTRWAIPKLVESRGMVINIGSAITAVPNPIFGAYGATKAGLAYWNDALRRELKRRGVRVCLVEPGPVATGFFEALKTLAPGTSGRIYDAPPAFLTATPEQVARRVARLLDHPRRRVAVLRRVVWPFHAIGLVLRMIPPLGDLAIEAMPDRLPPPRAEKADLGEPTGRLE